MIAGSRKLTVADIADARAYERERAAFREHIIELKRVRRVHVGTVVSIVFENRDTMRYQVQEMARVEKIFTDDGIQAELDVYNPLVPEPGELCATLFLELTSDDQVREWLPRLVGIERSIVLRLADGQMVRCEVEAQHASQLTREEATAAVHFVHFRLTTAQVAQFRDGTELVVDHPHYQEAVELSPSTVAALRRDLEPDQA